MFVPRIIEIHHPSGKLYEAFTHFADTHPEASFFQSAHFFRFMEQWPEAQAVLLLAVDEQQMKDPGDAGRRLKVAENKRKGKEDANSGSISGGSLVAGSLLAAIIREETPRLGRWWPMRDLHGRLSARTVVYGGPLLAGGTRLERETTLKALLGALHMAVGGRSLFTQFRNFYDMEDFKPVFRSMGYRFQERLNLLVDSTSVEQAWKRLSANRRRQVRLSQKQGAIVISEPDADQVDDFYCILQQLYKKKVKKPLPSRAFFHAIAAMEQGLLLLVEMQGRIIGGVAMVLMPKRAAYEWYACGLDREYRPRQIYPSVLATWAALEYAATHDLPQFDFMGMGRPDTPYGVREFKRRFGGSWVNFGRFSRINNRFSFFFVELAYNLQALWPRK